MLLLLLLFTFHSYQFDPEFMSVIPCLLYFFLFPHGSWCSAARVLKVKSQFELQHKSQLLVLSDMSRDCCQGLSQSERLQAGPEPLIMPCLPALLRYYVTYPRARTVLLRLGLLSLGSWKSVAVLGLLDYVQKVVDITQLHCK